MRSAFVLILEWVFGVKFFFIRVCFFKVKGFKKRRIS